MVEQDRTGRIRREGTFLFKDTLKFVQLNLVKAKPMWKLLLGEVIKLNIHVHIYISNNFIRTTNKLEMEKMCYSNSCLFCDSSTKCIHLLTATVHGWQGFSVHYF